MFGLESVQAASRIRAVIRGRMGFSFGRGCFDAGGFAFEVQLSITEKGELAPKSWTLIKAFSGALCKLGSVCDRTQLFQFQTATLAVVVIHIVDLLRKYSSHRINQSCNQIYP